MKSLNIYDDYGTIDVSLIHCFENKINYLFPDQYKKLLSRSDALIPEEELFYLSINGVNLSRDISFYGYGDNVPDYQKINKKQQDEDVYFHEHIVIFGCSANGDYICFDYRFEPTTNNPAVVLMLHDEHDEHNKMLVYPVADSFEEFINSLCKAECDD